MSYYQEKLGQIMKDEYQYSAYKSDNSTVVIAGPGSGKTTVLTLKIMRLLREKIRSPRGLACVTFSNEAVKEFKGRLKKLGYRKRENVFLGTVHSFCISEIIMPFAHLYEYDIPLPLKIISEKEKREVFSNIIVQLGYEHLDITVEAMDKERVLGIEGVSNVEVESFEVALKVAIEYEKKIKEMGNVDFINIVKYSTKLIQNEKYVRKYLEAKYPWLLIDEYQDLGKPLHEMILSLHQNTNIKIFAVGDPDQSIYGFNGAMPDYLLELYDNDDFIPVKLLTNYRSNQDIIDASMIALNISNEGGYISGVRKTEKANFRFITCNNGLKDQYIKIATEIIPECLDLGISLDEIAVLVKGKKEILELSQVFKEINIPYYISKHEFERSHTVEWLEKCAIWANNEIDNAFPDISEFWMRLLNRHGKKISSTQVLFRRRELYHILTNSKKYKTSLIDWLSYIIDQTGLLELLKGSSVYPDEVENLEKLMEVAFKGKFSEYNIEEFGKLGKPENQVTISTRHSSKGLEFEVVILLAVEEGIFPYYKNVSDSKKLSEERRVFFVCISRAKSSCYLLRSVNYISQYGNPYRRKPSMFWNILYERYGER